jgi:hypothetical protein
MVGDAAALMATTGDCLLATGDWRLKGNMAGYSGTPLVKKIGIKPGHRLAILNPPPGFDKELAPLPDGVVNADKAPLDVAILFAANQSALAKNLGKLAGKLAPAGMLWVAWPKMSSGVPTDLKEGLVQKIGLAAGLVDIKVCAVNEVWSGLKFVIRVKDRR